MIDLPLVIGIIATISGVALGWLGYRRSKKVDKSTESSQMISAQSGAVGQVITGLNLLIDNLQEDNKEIRIEIKGMAVKLEECVEARDNIRKEMDVLNKKYGANGG